MPFWRKSRPPAQIDELIAERIDPAGPGLALSVVKGGAIVHAAGYGMADVRSAFPATPDTIFHLASCGKQFTGLGMLMLEEDGRLRLDDPLSKHLPSLAGYGPGLSLRHLLHHTSGIRDLYDEEGAMQVLSRNEMPTNADLVRTYAELGCPMARPGLKPGDEFAYSNSGYDLLGAVIERVGGERYADFFRHRVFAPLAMRDTFSVPHARISDQRTALGYVLDERGELVEHGGSEFDGLLGSGSFYTTVSDLCRYERGFRAGIVSPDSMDAMLSSGVTNDGESTNYGFGWYLGSYDGIGLVDHAGSWNGFSSYICICFDVPLSIFALSNAPELDLVEVANLATDVYR